MKSLNQIPKILFVLVLCSAFIFQNKNAWAQQPQSDYEIQKEFKERLNSYQQQLEEADSSATVDSLIADIKEFEETYREHSELLNKALYPETFQQKIDQLKKTSVLAQKRLETIEGQDERLTKLEKQLTDYKSDLERLDRRSDSLQQAMQKSIQSEKKLSAMVRQYRESLEQRDELVLAFIDSMVIAYENMDMESVQDLENIDKKSRFSSNGNALAMIHSITDENLQVLKNNSSRLHFQDYMRMSEVQTSFEKMWKRLGDRITAIYRDNNAEEKAEQIDKNLAEWKKLLRDQTYAALQDSLKTRNIEVQEFSSSEGLFSSLTNYLDEQIANSRNGSTDASYQRFTQFQDFWNNIGLQWSANLKNANILDSEQIAVIDQKVDTWAQHAQPQSNILVYLLGASVLAIVALSIFLAKEKSRGK